MKAIKVISTIKFFIICCLCLPFSSCGKTSEIKTTNYLASKKNVEPRKQDSLISKDTATFAAGCFWCIEEQFKQLQGVISVTSGYTGGTIDNPTYEQVSFGGTGHAEAINIIYDSAEISYSELLEAFFIAHDPTQLNRQGNDVGTQYRSAVFYHNAEQKKIVEYYIKQLNKEKVYNDLIVTEVASFGKFYEAEEYHQNYYANNPDKAYCRLVVKPKVDKFKKVFADKIKK